MDIFELDKQLTNNLGRFNKILDESEATLREATNLQSKLESEAFEIKDYFENQTIGLRDVYKKRLSQIEAEHKQDKEAFSLQVKDFNDYHTKVVTLFEKLEKDKAEIDLILSQLEGLMSKKWSEFEKGNTKKLSNLEHKIYSSIESLKESCDEENAKLIKSSGDINIAISAVEQRIESVEKSFISQIALVEENVAILTDELKLLKQFSKALKEKTNNDKVHSEKLLTKFSNSLKIGFIMTGLFLLLLFVGWFLK